MAAPSFQLAQAVVQLSLQGKDALTGALNIVVNQVNNFNNQVEAGNKKQKKQNSELIDALKDFQRSTTIAFAAATAAAAGFVQAASPTHWATLTGSIGLLAGSIGELFLPAVEKAIDFIQDLDEWFRNLDPATKEQIATWALWGGAILAVVVIGPRLVGLLRLVLGFLAPLNAAVVMAAGGFTGLGTSIRGATSAMMAWLAANPVTAILALAAAVAALGFAWDSITGRGEGLGGGLRTPVSEGEAPGQAALVQRVLQRTRSMGLFESPLQNPGAYRRDELIRAGVRPEIANELYNRGGIGGTGFFGGGGRSLTGEQIRAAVGSVRTAPAVQAAGRPPAARRPRLTATNFQASLGGIESAWQRLQLAAGSSSTLEAERTHRELLRQYTLEQIRDRLPPDPNAPRPVPQPPGNVGGF